jgi:peroxiredoxin
MQRLLTETEAVQTLLNTLLSGIILLVSIVVSTSAIVLSYDITSLDAQADRIEAAMEFRRDVARLTEDQQSPTDPESFLRAMTGIIEDRAEGLAEASTNADKEFADEIQTYTDSVLQTVSALNQSLDRLGHREFGALWEGLEVNYGPHLNRSDRFTVVYEDRFSETGRQQFDELVTAFELFAMGKDVSVLALSSDSVYSHRAFAEEYNLHMPLLSDTDGTVAAAYGVAVDDEGAGHLAKRAVIVVDHTETVQYTWASENPGQAPRAEEIRSAVEGIGDAETAVDVRSDAACTVSNCLIRDSGAGIRVASEFQ